LGSNLESWFRDQGSKFKVPGSLRAVGPMGQRQGSMWTLEDANEFVGCFVKTTGPAVKYAPHLTG